MNRSRTALLVAWGLFALIVLVQLFLPSGGSESALDADRTPLPDRGLPYAADPDPATETRSRSQGPIDRPRSANPDRSAAIVDDPARWHQAGVARTLTSHVATVRGDGVAATEEPGSGRARHWFPNPTQFGGERAFLVLDQESSVDYVKVSLPVMPNGQEGWIPRSEVDITEIEHRALVDLSDDTVTVWDGDRVIVDTKAVTGKPATPTPVGVFYVRDVIAQPDPGGAFGPYILALSGFSEVLETFQGGLPALAIHGTDNPAQIGTERSNGCLRIPNELITILADTVPLGTPVTVVA